MTSVLILAGSRNETCKLCEEAGVASKGLISLAGVRMIDHVLRAVRDAPELTGTVWVTGLSLETIKASLPADLTDFVSRVRQAPIGKGPAAAMLATLENGAHLPLLVTTCDHPLLTPAMLKNFVEQANEDDSDFSVGLAARPVIDAAYPEVKRTYIKLAGRDYSGCNLFYVATPLGRKVVSFWRDIGRDRKNPLKIARRFGFGALIGMLSGRLDLAKAFRHGSSRVGADVTPVIIPIAEAAIDVDKPSDLVLAGKILEKRFRAALVL